MTHHEWGLLIVIYLFTGGLGAGCLALSGVAQLIPGRRYRGIARAGALCAPLLVAFGSGLLIFDLGRPLRFWRLFVTIVPVSPMSIGSWLLMLFVPIAFVTGLLQLPPAWCELLAARLPRWRGALRTLGRWNAEPPPTPEPPASSLGAAAATLPSPAPPWVSRLRTALAAAGIPLGLGVGIYTGVLLGAIPARPFWNTPMVAQLFLFSALSTATALLMLTLPRLAGPGASLEGDRRALIGADLIFIAIELLIVVPFVIHGELSVLSARDALGMILGGPYTIVFWGGVVALGVVLPAAIEVAELLRGRNHRPSAAGRALHVVVPLLVLTGGFLLRWVFVHAGQDTKFLD